MTSDGRYVSKELCFLIGQHKIALVSNTIYIDVTIINICSARGFAICCMNASGKKKKKMSFVWKTDVNFEYLLVPNASCHFESGKFFQNFFII